MRLGQVTLALALIGAAMVPGWGLAQDESAAHHHESGPANPMVKDVTLFLDGKGALGTSPSSAALVPAGTANVNGESAPVIWSVKATKNTSLATSPFINLVAKATAATVAVGGPDGAAFQLQLLKNGKPVDGASSTQKISDTVIQPDTVYTLKVFLPTSNLSLAPGDELGLAVSYFGLNPEGQKAMSYQVGGDAGSRMVLRLNMASLKEVGLPADIGPWQVTPLATFNPEAAKKPGLKVFTLKAYQYHFDGAPITVDVGDKVLLQLYVDESLSSEGEGHAGHGHANGNLSWDQNQVTPLHGFSLAALHPTLQTVLFDGLVVSMPFTADKAGNYTFMCTVFCGTGHGKMLDKLTIRGPAGATPGAGGDSDASLQPMGEADQTPAKTPGFEAAFALAAVAGVALLARRRR